MLEDAKLLGPVGLAFVVLVVSIVRETLVLMSVRRELQRCVSELSQIVRALEAALEPGGLHRPIRWPPIVPGLPGDEGTPGL